ncbi:sprouty-related, EVH1 domain-containing protein 2-like isoform X2 [Anneissia japonica]|uniref:sprouty-related, EVH1 domain-containing protein 2-like isoform X2 n=1 Tax=Anneissia japonica TaxID=1529436 RepID=UPI001425568F|nr:sprouty-related, EVH1 domain-containing protein 2-like isoform X2 [Anneissia japonica]
MMEDRFSDEESMVRVKAQVMIPTDGMWVPLDGGLSTVGIYKHVYEDSRKFEYWVRATQNTDLCGTIVVDCQIKKDLRYVKPSPIFHHWLTDNKKFGLVYNNTYDAKAFDRGIQRAVEELMDGSSTESSTNQVTDNELGDDDVFVPVEPLLSPSPIHDYQNTPPLFASRPLDSYTSTLKNVITQPPRSDGNQYEYLHRVHYLPRRMVKKEVWVKSHPEWQSVRDQPCKVSSGPKDSYVQFVKNCPSRHDYSYPTLNTSKFSERHPIATQPKNSLPPLLPDKNFKVDPKVRQERCVHCLNVFDPRQNRRGQCQYAPDSTLHCIEKLTCYCLAEGLQYHCCSDGENDYSEGCSCDPRQDGFCKKWTALSAISLCLPCLFCYLPLRACHKVGVKCGVCGGKHVAV